MTFAHDCKMKQLREDLNDCIRELFEMAQPPAPTWQPIESAPRDGTFILATWGNDYPPAVVRFAPGKDRDGNVADWWDDYGGTYMEALFWMPLPKPPEKEPSK